MAFSSPSPWPWPSPSPSLHASLLHTNAFNPNSSSFNPNSSCSTASSSSSSSSPSICLLRTRKCRSRRMYDPSLNIFDGLLMRSRASSAASDSSSSSSSSCLLFSHSSKKKMMMPHARASIELRPSPKPKLSTISTTLTGLIRRIILPSRTDTDFASFSNASDWIQHVLNVSSKWMVLAAVTGVVIWRHDEQAYWAVIGGVANGVASKLLKKAFNEQRPITALGQKADPGMPSTHAQSFGFFSLYASLSLISWRGIRFLPISVSVILFGFYLAWLRVSRGLHTREQVIAGTTFGYGMAALWIRLWNRAAGNAVFHYALKSLYLLSLLYFTIYALKNWRFGHP